VLFGVGVGCPKAYGADLHQTYSGVTAKARAG